MNNFEIGDIVNIVRPRPSWWEFNRYKIVDFGENIDTYVCANMRDEYSLVLKKYEIVICPIYKKTKDFREQLKNI